jgi:hypothetical protein
MSSFGWGVWEDACRCRVHANLTKPMEVLVRTLHDLIVSYYSSGEHPYLAPDTVRDTTCDLMCKTLYIHLDSKNEINHWSHMDEEKEMKGKANLGPLMFIEFPL